MFEALAPGRSISYRAGHAVVTLGRTDTGTWTVTCYLGSYRVEDNCAAFPDSPMGEVEARRVARLYAQMYTEEHRAARRAVCGE